MTTSLLSLDAFKARTSMPLKVIDEVEARSSGFTQTQLEMYSSRISAQLAKRYDPFVADALPEIVALWLTQLVTMAVWLRRGFSPTDAEAAVYVADRDTALSEIAAAANSETGLYDLPRTTGESAISRGGPRTYSETSPYVHRRIQQQIGRQEDAQGRGTRRG